MALPYVAGGTIEPSRFVYMSAAYTVSQVTATTLVPCGISQDGSRAPQGVAEMYGGTSLTQAATTGEQIRVFGPGEDCLLQMGATCAAGAILISDANARGAVWSSTAALQYPGAYALEAATATGQYIRVQVKEPGGSRGTG